MKDWKYGLSIGCLIVGILISLQFKAQEKEGFPLAAARPTDLIRLVKDSEREKVELQDQIKLLRGRLTEYESVKEEKGKVSQVLAKELLQTRLEAGVISVE